MISKGVQDPGLNPSRDILLRSTLFEDFTWLGIGHWVFVVSYSYPGRSLKQEISAILLFSFIGDAVEVPERMKPVEPVLDVDPEKEKPSTASRSRCLRSSAPRRARKRKPTKTRGIRTQDMIEGGTHWSDESAPESVEDGCLLLGLTQDTIELD